MTTSPTTGTSAVPLSVAMRTGSQGEHRDAEGSVFVTSLLAGQVSELGYVGYLARLVRIYDALERVGRALAADPIGAAVHDPALERHHALTDDLAYWAARAEVPVPVASPGCAYADRIEASSSWSGLYVAHHYTRYLGDLSGGQAFKAALRRRFDVGDRGLAFYTFADVPRPKTYKDAYRERLDALGLDERDQRRVVAEVRAAFRLNQQVFAEIARDLPGWTRADGA